MAAKKKTAEARAASLKKTGTRKVRRAYEGTSAAIGRDGTWRR